jgi:hypothetical protein
MALPTHDAYATFRDPDSALITNRLMEEYSRYFHGFVNSNVHMILRREIPRICQAVGVLRSITIFALGSPTTWDPHLPSDAERERDRIAAMVQLAAIRAIATIICKLVALLSVCCFPIPASIIPSAERPLTKTHPAP